MVCGRSGVPVLAKMIFFSGAEQISAHVFVSVWQCAWSVGIITLIDNFSSGFAVGTFVAGIISDMFGRKRCT